MSNTPNFSIKRKQFFNAFDKDNRDIDPVFLYTMVRRENNHIYFYSDVDEVSQYVLIQYLLDAQSDILENHAMDILDGRTVEGIILHINSRGGLLNSGFALYDFIKSMRIPVFGLVEGEAASAASLIYLATENRAMTNNSVVLVHQLSYGAEGNMTQLTDAHINAEHAMKRLLDIYLNDTKLGYPLDEQGKIKLTNHNMSDEELYEYRKTNIQELLKRDLELDKSNCMAYGIVTWDDNTDCCYDSELTEEEQEQVEKYAEELIKNRNKTEEVKQKRKTTSKKSKSRKK